MNWYSIDKNHVAVVPNEDYKWEDKRLEYILYFALKLLPKFVC